MFKHQNSGFKEYAHSSFQGSRVGVVLSNSLKKSPDEIVIVHHIWNQPNGAVLQIERRDKDHNNCKFERITL